MNEKQTQACVELVKRINRDGTPEMNLSPNDYFERVVEPAGKIFLQPNTLPPVEESEAPTSDDPLAQAISDWARCSAGHPGLRDILRGLLDRTENINVALDRKQIQLEILVDRLLRTAESIESETAREQIARVLGDQPIPELPDAEVVSEPVKDIYTHKRGNHVREVDGSDLVFGLVCPKCSHDEDFYFIAVKSGYEMMRCKSCLYESQYMEFYLTKETPDAKVVEEAEYECDYCGTRWLIQCDPTIETHAYCPSCKSTTEVSAVAKVVEKPNTFRVLGSIEETDASGQCVKCHDDPTELSSQFITLEAAQKWVKNLEEYDANL